MLTSEDVEPVVKAYCYCCNNYFSVNLLSLKDTFACKCQLCNRQVLFDPMVVLEAIEDWNTNKEKYITEINKQV